MIHLNSDIKRVAAIHDLSGFSRCSLMAAIPILTVMGHQCCPLPTALLSSQTGFGGFTCFDFTNEMPAYIHHWQELGLSFDTIYSGFLGSENQIDIVIDFIKRFRKSGTLVAVDPVMGDNGAKYPTFSDRMCEEMKRLVRCADIVFPNMTEAAMLTGAPMPEKSPDDSHLSVMAKEISSMGPKQVVITGVVRGDAVYNYVYDFNIGRQFQFSAGFNHCSYSGTGDIFASIVCGCLTRGEVLEQAVKKATRFIEKAVKYTHGLGTEPREGIAYEGFLKELI